MDGDSFWSLEHHGGRKWGERKKSRRNSWEGSLLGPAFLEAEDVEVVVRSNKLCAASCESMTVAVPLGLKDAATLVLPQLLAFTLAVPHLPKWSLSLTGVM